MFIDRIKIYVKAGDGGNGAISFRREKYVSHGGPDGGDGGNGGNIIFRINEGMNTLLSFRYKRKFVASNGANGAGAKFHGARGEDIIIDVPAGTLIKDAESGRILKDMSDCGEFVCCRGGKGGFGNRHFATPTRQVPNFAKNGTKGEERELQLELKMLADVGLVGFPSVGKSSILAAISSARPKVAEYHFTTLEPNLGVVSLDGDGKGFVAADIPGLIEGAADGAGLGHEFLRHVDRCRLLLHVVDIARTEERDPVDDIIKINTELERYSPELASRPQIIVANKCDVLDPELTDIKAFESFVKSCGWELIYVSAATGENMKAMVRLVAERLRELPPLKIYESEPDEDVSDIKPDVRETVIKRENNTYVVEGEWLYELMGRINFDDYESLNYFGKMLQNSGLYGMLEEKGCKDGDTVSIYGFEFDYIK